jgi:aquaporin Z
MTPAIAQPRTDTPLGAPRSRWRVYAVEAALLGLFMLSACSFAALLEHPASPVCRAVPSPFVRRALMGLAMGGTAVALIYSAWGRRSGTHMNPAVTLCFLRLGRIGRGDAACYVLAQFAGAAAGVAVASAALGMAVGHPAVNYVATVPGASGLWPAWAGEFASAFILMFTVLAANKAPRLMRFTGLFAGALVALYITFEAPLSGMSMNPARTLGSAVSARLWQHLWIYFTAPVLGMLAAVELHRRLSPHPQRLCGKYTHSRKVPCVTRCDCHAA